MRAEEDPDAGFESAVETLNHRRFFSTVRAKILHHFPVRESLQLLIDEFFPNYGWTLAGLLGVYT